MKFFLLFAPLLVGCATIPPTVVIMPTDKVCYTKAESAALAAQLAQQNMEIDDLINQMAHDRRKNEQLHTRIDGLKGYCL